MQAAVINGAVRCVRLLLPLCQASARGPDLFEVAAIGGHADVLRVLLREWPQGSGSLDTAFSISVALGDKGTQRLLEGLGQFTWGSEVVDLLRGRPHWELYRLAEQYGCQGWVWRKIFPPG